MSFGKRKWTEKEIQVIVKLVSQYPDGTPHQLLHEIGVQLDRTYNAVLMQFKTHQKHQTTYEKPLIEKKKEPQQYSQESKESLIREI